MAESESGFFRGAGGGVFELLLPLSENFEQQLQRGQLVRVDSNGEPFETSTEGPKRPAANASKNDWVGYALFIDPTLTVDDADAMTRNDLAEKYGK
jgi:hypothetical protein